MRSGWIGGVSGGSLAACVVFSVAALCARAEIVDRIAVSVGDRVITTSDLDREIRVTAFLDGKPPDLRPTAKRAAADRMVEQALIRRELETSRYPVPSAAEIEPVIAQFKRGRFKDEADYRQALGAAGVTDQEVRDELLWQRTLLRFIDERFRAGVQVTEQQILDYFEKVVKSAAEAAHPGKPATLEEYRDQIEETLAGPAVDWEVDNWLAGARRRTEIVYHDEVFQ